MIMAAIGNALTGDSLKGYFVDEGVEKRLRPAMDAQVFGSDWKPRESISDRARGGAGRAGSGCRGPRHARTGGSYSKGQARRQGIVDEALVVFARSGFDGGSLRAIVKRVGLTPTGLMHHFASKEGLFTEVLRTARRDGRARPRPIPEHTLRRTGDEVVAHNERSRGPHVVHAIVSAEATDTEHPSHEEFARRYRQGAARRPPPAAAQARRRGAEPTSIRRWRPG